MCRDNLIAFDCRKCLRSYCLSSFQRTALEALIVTFQWLPMASNGMARMKLIASDSPFASPLPIVQYSRYSVVIGVRLGQVIIAVVRFLEPQTTAQNVNINADVNGLDLALPAYSSPFPVLGRELSILIRYSKDSKVHPFL